MNYKLVQIKTFTFIILAIMLFAAPVKANNSLSIEPVVGHKFGSTWYRLQVFEPIVEPQENFDFTDVGIQSELEYPLDVAIAGMAISTRFKIRGKNYFVKLRAWGNLNDPGEKMQDSDWFGAKNSNVTSLYKFSYTQSRSKLIWAGAELDIESQNHVLFNRPVIYGMRFMGDYSYHKMYDIRGWYKLPGSDKTTYESHINELVLTYKLLHLEPDFYLKLKLAETSKYSWHTTLLASPLVFAYDKDDHVLRNKNTETKAFGFSAGLLNELTINLNRDIALTAALNIHYFRTEGGMRQKFYGDDPGTEDKDETGLEFKNIDNVISMFTQEIALGIRVSF